MRDNFLLRLRPRHISRYREIVSVFARLGFGTVITQLGLDDRFNIPRRLMRGNAEEVSRTPPAVRLRLALEELGATFIKLGQIASTRPDILPPSVLLELTNLQDNVPGEPWEAVAPVIERELGRTVDDAFRSFDRTPMAAASLAQVHPAVLHDGTEVVVKVQRPNVDRTVETDLEIIMEVARLIAEQMPGLVPFDPVEMADEFAAALREELDYLREGRNADRFRRNFEGEPAICVPRVYWDYTTRSLMVQQRIRGIKIDDIDALDAAGYNRDRIAQHAASLIVKEVLDDGFFHADPHPGNMLIMPGEVIGLIDFGTVGYLDERDKANVVRLFTSLVSLDAESTVEQLIRMGIAEPGIDQAGLERDLRKLLRQYVGLPLKDVSAANLINQIQPIIYQHRLRMPGDYWLLLKTLVVMEGVGSRLAPDFDVFAAARPHVSRLTARMALPTSWGPDLLRGVGGWGTFLNELPRRSNRLLAQIERGNLRMEVHDPATEHLARQVNAAANRLIQAILLGSLILGLALFLPRIDLTWPWGLPTWLALGAFIVVMIQSTWLLWSIWRSGRRP